MRGKSGRRHDIGFSILLSSIAYDNEVWILFCHRLDLLRQQRQRFLWRAVCRIETAEKIMPFGVENDEKILLRPFPPRSVQRETVDTQNRLPRRETEPAGCRKANAKACETSGTFGHRYTVEIGKGRSSLRHNFEHQRHKTGILPALHLVFVKSQNSAVLPYARGAGFSGTVETQDSQN